MKYVIIFKDGETVECYDICLTDDPASLTYRDSNRKIFNADIATVISITPIHA